jgi:hypothetical protein
MPDILVSERDGFHDALAVEVKSSALEQPAAERQLKRYMVGMSCPVGLVVTPDRLWVYRETYRTRKEDSIEPVGDFPATGLFGPDIEGTARANAAPSRGAVLADVVQAWLETLKEPSATSSLSPDLRDVLEVYVVPALLEGQVYAGLPRFRQTGS